jgi:ubiquitin-conjugating enzyme E2 J1
MCKTVPSNWVHACAQDFPKEERALLAAKSRAAPPHFGSPERQRVTDKVHAAMLAAEAPAASQESCAEARAAAAHAAAARLSAPSSPAQPDTSTGQEQHRPEGATAAPPAAAASSPQVSSSLCWVSQPCIHPGSVCLGIMNL